MKRFALALVFVAAVAAWLHAESAIEILNVDGCDVTEVNVQTYSDASMQEFVAEFTVYGVGPVLLTDYVTQEQANASHYAVGYSWQDEMYCGAQNVPVQ